MNAKEKREHAALLKKWSRGSATPKQIARCMEFDRKATAQMDRTRAAVCLVNRTSGDNSKLALGAFMDIFHPGHPMTRDILK